MLHDGRTHQQFLLLHIKLIIYSIYLLFISNLKLIIYVHGVYIYVCMNWVHPFHDLVRCLVSIEAFSRLFGNVCFHSATEPA